MLQRVHSIWNYVARSIYPDLTDDIPGTQTSEEENSWRSAFHREREKARDRISSLRDPTDPSAAPRVRNILDVLRIYPATLDIQVEAMWAFRWRISHITEKDNSELENAGRPYVNTIYSALSRHVLRPNPYAAQDLNSQIKEHTTVTPRSIRALCLGTLILESLEKLHHHCPTAITILLDFLLVLTAGRTLRKKIGHDWMLTKQVAFILLMYLRGMKREDLAAKLRSTPL